MKDIIEIVKFLEDSGLLLKGVSEIVQNEAREQIGGFLSMLLGTVINRAGKGVIRAGYGNKRQDYEKNGSLMPPHSLTNFVIKILTKRTYI